MQRTLLSLFLAIAFMSSNVNGIAVAEEPGQSLQSLLDEARDAQSRRDFSAAAEGYRKAVELDPSVAELWTNLGLMYHETGKPNEAMQSFKEAIRLKSSLFVPQLFMGIELLAGKDPEAAIPFLERAEKLNPDDLQAALNLAKAYELVDKADRASDAYSVAARLRPDDGNIWLSLGTTYLQQVESDARRMTSASSHSPYLDLRAAETFAEEGKLVQSEDAFKAAIASGSPAPCTHAEYGITLLRKQSVAKAREQFALETNAGTHCGLTALGLAAAELVEGRTEDAFARLTSILKADRGFLESSLPLFRDAVSAEQARSFVTLVRQKDSAHSIDLGSMMERVFISQDTVPAANSGDEAHPAENQTAVPESAERLYAMGQYARCDESLKAALGTMAGERLQLLASCSFYTGDFQTTSAAAQRMKTNVATRVHGLYWESKADEKLAIAALIRAGEIGADSSRMHVLLGDVFRQKRRWDDAEVEYRKAIALDPKSHAARLSLAIALFSELKNDEAFEIGRNLLAEDPSDPEANLLEGEILVQRNLFAEAEPYLSNCQNLKTEFVPRRHALMGKVYAETGRVPAAISEYQAGISADEDGSIHFQLARLYQRTGERKAADEAFKESKRLRGNWDDRARVALEQSSTNTSLQ